VEGNQGKVLFLCVCCNYAEVASKTLKILHFLVLDNGKVIKAVNAGSADTTEKVSPVVIEEIQVFPPQVAVRNLKVVRDSSLPDGRLVVVADGEVQALRLHRCYSDKILSCKYVFVYFS
jgi:semaphorin 6